MTWRRDRGDRGANLVEFAILLPLLVLLVLGIIEFAWVFAQNLNVRHGAREGARLAAVDFGGGTNPLVAETCSRMDFVTGASMTLASTDVLPPAGVGVGDEVAVTIDAPVSEITGFFSGWFPASLTSTVAIRMEQSPSWTDGTTACP